MQKDSTINRRVKKVLENPWSISFLLLNSRISRFLTDRLYLKMRFRASMGRKLNINNPQTFNEKLQWMKLYNRNPDYTRMVDKYEVKKYVSNIIGEEYVIPTLGIWDSFDEIDFNSLPDSFVLKCTHDSGGLVICKNKSNLDLNVARKKISESLSRNYYYHGREWPYKNVKPRIIAEKYMTDMNGTCCNNDNDFGRNVCEELKDYKFYCFNGIVKLVMLNSDRFSTEPTKADYFDKNFKHLDLKWGYENAKTLPEKPEQFERMCAIAEKLSKNIPHVRVDMYLSENKIYFGELTFYDGSGFDKIEPIEWDYRIGEWVDLKNI